MTFNPKAMRSTLRASISFLHKRMSDKQVFVSGLEQLNNKWLILINRVFNKWQPLVAYEICLRVSN